MTPKVLNKRTDHISPDAILVDRTTKWGNPYKIGAIFAGRPITRDYAVMLHKDWLLYSDEGHELLQDIGELRGHDLVCWDAPWPCHADILLELANKDG